MDTHQPSSSPTKLSASVGIGAPLWKKVSADLMEEIHNGVFASGFPGEVELAKRYGVSRGTIRAALRPLREAGHITAQPGRKPVVVAGSSTAYGPIYSVLASIRESGMNHSSIVLAQHLTRDRFIAEHISLDADTEFFHLSRVRLADGKPLGLDQVWLPGRVAAKLLEADFSQAALYEELDRRCGIVLDGGTEQLTAVSASADQAALLNCAEGEPLLLIERSGCYRAQTVEFRRSYILGERMAITTSFGCKADPNRAAGRRILSGLAQ